MRTLAQNRAFITYDTWQYIEIWLDLIPEELPICPEDRPLGRGNDRFKTLPYKKSVIFRNSATPACTEQRIMTLESPASCDQLQYISYDINWPFPEYLLQLIFTKY